MKKAIKTAVIGVGNMGFHHARVLSWVSDLAAVCDVDDTTAKSVAKSFKCKAYTDYKELIESEKPDAVTIAVPTVHHFDVADYCLSNKIPILIEKPITPTAKEAWKLINKAKNSGIFLMVGHIERFNPAVRILKNLIDAGKLGQVISLLALRVGLQPPKQSHADVVLDLAIHDIDVFSYLINEHPTQIKIKRTKLFNRNIADAGVVMLTYSGTTGVIQTNWITPIKIRQLFVTGTEGFVKLDYIQQKLTLYDKLLSIKPVGDYFEVVSRFTAPSKELFVSRKEPLMEEMAYFLSHLNDRKPDETSSFSMKAVELLTKT